MDVRVLTAEELANIIINPEFLESVLLIDTRSLLEYNDQHISGAVNICCSKLVKRRLQNGTVSMFELLDGTCSNWLACREFIVYDRATWDMHGMSDCHIFYVLVEKLAENFPDVAILEGGFTEFAYKFPKLCESKRKSGCALLSISTPCASAINCPPTKVLPFLYLGSEKDAQSEDVLRTCHVKYVLNASQTAADTPHCSMGHYLRIPIQDSSNENIVVWFQTAFDFIDKVKESDDHVLLHCVGGVSRSATIAIAYVMKYLSLSLDNAYRYVKEKRPTISPNLNFMGQLLQYEQELLKETELICTPLSELKLDGLRSPTLDYTSKNFPDNKFTFINHEKFSDCGFPSPDSDVATPSSSNSDVLPSPASDDIPSPHHQELNSTLKPFTLEIDFGKKPTHLIKPRNLKLNQDISR